MPIYEYQCQACQHDIEIIQKLSDSPLRDCPSCGEPAMKKKVSAAAFRLKGGGWYETDFKTGDKKNIAGEKSSADKSAKSDSNSGNSGTSKKSDDAGSGSKVSKSGSSDSAAAS
jgi:putative FmdB family regulatory protein